MLHPPPPRRDMPTSGRGETAATLWRMLFLLGAGIGGIEPTVGFDFSINILLPPGEVHSSLAHRPGRTFSRLHAISPPPPTLKLPGGGGPLYFKPARAFPCYKYLFGNWRGSLLSEPPARKDLLFYWSGVFMFSSFISLSVYRPFSTSAIPRRGGMGLCWGYWIGSVPLD
jgi:hypothetical protein